MQTCRIESRFWACAAVIALMVLLIPPLISQTVATEILGLVTDTTGAVVPGAKVTITRAATGETRTVETNRVGDYSFQIADHHGTARRNRTESPPGLCSGAGSGRRDYGGGSAGSCLENR